MELKSELFLWWEEGRRAGVRRVGKAGNAVLVFSSKSYVMVGRDRS